jgi:hypothetical protein
MGLIEDGALHMNLFSGKKNFADRKDRSDRKTIGDKSPYH